jgi:hypothetical protein
MAKGGGSGGRSAASAKLASGGKGNSREYVNNSLGRGVSGAIGPTHDGVRTISGQGKKGGSFYELGEVSVRSGQLVNTERYGKQNTRDAQTVLDAYLRSG